MRIIDQVSQKNNDNRFGVIIFSNDVKVTHYLDDGKDKASLLAAISNEKFLDQATNTPKALSVMIRDVFNPFRGDRSNAINICIVLSDGEPNMENNEPDHVADMRRWTAGNATEAKRRGVKIYAVGVGANINKNTLADIASDPADRYVHDVMDFDKLERVMILENENSFCYGPAGE